MTEFLKKSLDFFRLIIQVPRAHQIFLRKEYEQLAGLLRWLARLYRYTFLRKTCLIAVVGSLGKTTSRRAVHVALDCPDRGFAFSNYGAALAANVLRIRPGDARAVIEAGISGPGWMKIYSWFLKPDIVVVTSIKSDHYRSFPTLEHTRNEKVEIVRRLNRNNVAILNGDDPNVRWMASQTVAKVITYGFGADNDIRALHVKATENGVCFDVMLRTRRISVETGFVGEHMVYPFLAALAVAEWEDVDIGQAANRLRTLKPADSRMEVVRLADNITILDDSSKSGMETIHVALDGLATLPASRRLILFSGVEDPPGKQTVINREIGRHMAEVADHIYWMGSRKNMNALDSGAIAAGMPTEHIHAIGFDISSAINILKKVLQPGDVLLVKGRGRQRLRRIVLGLSGLEVSCSVSYCGVKVTSCEVCPLLAAPPQVFQNRFISRYVRE